MMAFRHGAGEKKQGKKARTGSSLMAMRVTAVAATAMVAAAVAVSVVRGVEGYGSIDGAVDRLREYLRFDTRQPNPVYYEVQSWLRHEVQSLGMMLHVEYFGPHHSPVVLGTWLGHDSTLPAILLTSHIDVVGTGHENWTYDPVGAEIVDGPNGEKRIVARGAQDMKSVGMMHLEAIRRLRKEHFENQRTVHVLFVGDEEVGSEHGMQSILDHYKFDRMELALAIDDGLPSDRTDRKELRLFYAERAFWSFTIKATGRPGHGSRMFPGSAGEKLSLAIDRIYAWRDLQLAKLNGTHNNGQPMHEADITSVNLVYMKAGAPSPGAKSEYVMNVQPSEAEAGFDLRVSPLEDAAELENLIRNVWAPKSEGYVVRFVDKAPLADEDGKQMEFPREGNPWWTRIKAAIEGLPDGYTISEEVHPDSTDARYLRRKGVPTLGFSPMYHTPILQHEADEYITEEVFLKGVEVFAEVIRSLTSAKKDVDEAAGFKPRPRPGQNHKLRYEIETKTHDEL